MSKTSGKAIASLVLGIISIFLGWIPIVGWAITITGLVLGIIALSKISKDKNLSGRGMAIAGIVLASISLVINVLLVGIGILAYFGTLSPDKFLPNKCIFPSGIACTDFKATTRQLMMQVQNSLGYDINIDGATAHGCTDLPGQGALLNGGTKTLTFACINSGSHYNGEASITFIVTKTGIKHVINGQIISKIE